MAREKTYDCKCFDLAEFFLEDEPGLNTEANRRALAIEVQEAIESFITDKLRNYEPSDPMRGVEFPFAENH